MSKTAVAPGSWVFPLRIAGTTAGPEEEEHGLAAEELKRDIEEVTRAMNEAIRLSAIIHDIGMTSIPADVLSKPSIEDEASRRLVTESGRAEHTRGAAEMAKWIANKMTEVTISTEESVELMSKIAKTTVAATFALSAKRTKTRYWIGICVLSSFICACATSIIAGIVVGRTLFNPAFSLFALLGASILLITGIVGVVGNR